MYTSVKCTPTVHCNDESHGTYFSAIKVRISMSSLLGKMFKGCVVNWTCHYMIEGSRKITSTVPLIRIINIV